MKICSLLCCIAFLVVTALVSTAPVIADEEADGDITPAYSIEGAWWRVVGGPPYLLSVSHARGKSYYAAYSFLGNPDVSGFLGTTQQDGGASSIMRTGKNSYDFTSVQYYGDDAYDSEYGGTVWALVCSGPMEATGPEVLELELSCAASCNPCAPQCAALGAYDPVKCEELGDALWDPFHDPLAFCSPDSPFHLRYQRIPIEEPCVP